MMKTEKYEPKFVGSFPEAMEPGVLYISIEYGSCGHLCACGCGNEVVTPLGPAQWAVTYDGRAASLRPSVGNWSLPCRSHYIVDRGGKVRWAGTFTDAQIVRNRDRDRSVLQLGEDERTYEHLQPLDGPPIPEVAPGEARGGGLWARLRARWHH